MEIKDVILSTLKEIEESEDDIYEDEEIETKAPKNDNAQKVDNRANQAMMSMTGANVTNTIQSNIKEEVEKLPTHQISTEDFMSNNIKPSFIEPTTSTILSQSKASSMKDVLEDEKLFLNSVRERVLVLFEGLQSPNNRNIEAKVDLIINFLEYKLAIIDERLEKVQKQILSL